MIRTGAKPVPPSDPKRIPRILEDALIAFVILAAEHPDDCEIEKAVRQAEVALGRAIAARGFR